MPALEPELISAMLPENIVPDKEIIKYCGKCMIAMEKISNNLYKCKKCDKDYRIG